MGSGGAPRIRKRLQRALGSSILLAAALGGLLACSGRSAPEANAEPDWAALALERLPPLLERCEPPGLAEPVLCGMIEVAEDRTAEGGRTIGLKVLVVPARSERPPTDPVFVFEGGPGGAATGRAGGSIWSGPVRARDIVLVDQRGTGGSHPIDCDLGAHTDRSPGELREMFPPDAVRECAESLTPKTDLTLYTTAHFVDDIDEVRRRLGYGAINLRGGSYGSWAMMTFAQRHPESTRTLFGIGLDSPFRSNLAERGVRSDRTLQGLSRLCASQPDCGELVPDLRASVATLLSSLEEAPRTVALSDPVHAEETLTITVSRDWMAESIRLILYYAFTSRGLPWAVHRAEIGDWEPLVQLALFIERMFTGSLYGVLLTVQCSEQMQFDVEAAMARGEKTLIGNYRLEQAVQGCAAWPHREVDPLGVPELRVLRIPTLLLSGALDPVTPADYGEDVRRLFPESLHLVLPEGQHGPFDPENAWPCVHRIWADFLQAGTVEGLDTSCTEAMRRPPFLVEDEAFRTYLIEELVPLL